MKKQSNFKSLLSVVIVSLIITIVIISVVLSVGRIALTRPIVATKQDSFTNYNVAELYTPSTPSPQTLEIRRILTEFAVRYEINRFIVDDNILEVIEFYNRFTNDSRISEAIIRGALEFNIPINIAFALAWQESRFNYRAVNASNRNGTADWGLFQLNDRYNHLTRDQFFNIYTNAYTGLRYLREMLDLNGGDMIYSLYSYNAGPTRVVVHGNIPRITIKYVENILEYEDMLNQEFNKWLDDMHS